MKDRQKKSPEIIDLLATTPSIIPFVDRVKDLFLSSNLEQKVLSQEGRLSGHCHSTSKSYVHLTVDDEKELATEVLLLRHKFTEHVLHSKKFRQATLTVIQNIYLFKNRRIFFGTTSSTSSEAERQEALLLFSATPISSTSFSLAHTLQHLILARVWNRILSNSAKTDLQEQEFIELHAIVEKLNTIRNIYMILTTGLITKLATRINDIYKESVAWEDAIQIGSFGVARAAYRYHQSSGIRFSTFAASWVFKEIQRQSLKGRLIRISSNTIEQYSRAAKNNDTDKLCKFLTLIKHATITDEDTIEMSPVTNPGQILDHSPIAREVESRELYSIVLRAVDQQLSEKCRDIIKRRYGFPPYQGKEQSIISISEEYGVTRGSIYQLEQVSLNKLSHHLKTVLQ
jgi:RNA polymerase sigma factor (sigma-70 family)